MKKTAYTAHILTIGTELTRGECFETNASYLSRHLAPLGVCVRQITTIPDDLPLMVKTLSELRKRSRLLFISGGLGPTHDDLTREALARAFGKPLLFHPPLLKTIAQRFEKRGTAMPKINRVQAYLPKGSFALANRIGSAPGIHLTQGACEIFSLPGVPEELKRMFHDEVLPILRRSLPRLQPLLCRRVRTTGLPESLVAEKVSDILKKEKEMVFGLYAHPGVVDITVSPRNHLASSRRKIDRVLAQIKKRFGPRKTVSVAESCTGGAISSELTRLPGSSRHFHLGVVAYHNRMKRSILGVAGSLLAREGAVSPTVAKAMAKAARRLGKTDLGLGITGILGPTGGTKKKPIGLVYMALATNRQALCYEYHFQGDRSMIRRRATLAALELLRKELLR